MQNMSKIDDLIKELCPNGVEWKELGKVLKITTGKLNANAMEADGIYPFFTCSEKPYRINSFSFDTEAILISGNGSQVGHLNYYKGKFNAYQRTYILDNLINPVNIFFLFYFLKAYLKNYILENVKEGSVPYITLPMLQQFSIPIPPLPIQKEIVAILDKFTQLEAELEAELESRKKQYEYYRNKLLTPVEVDGKWFLNDKEVEWKTLGGVCLKTDNIKWKECREQYFKYIDLSSVNRLNNKITETQTINYTNAPSRAQQIVEVNDVIFGTTRPTLKRYSIITKEFHNQICSTGFCVLRANQEELLPKYLFFMLTTTNFYNYIENNQEGAGYPAISNNTVKKYSIPIPPLEEQERIVEILDRFDALVNDISIGLPAEIEARRKQYEYYRNKLLSFPAL